MARRYDSSTTTFSPEGRLHQVEYAIEAINNAGTCIGILAKDGIVMASERRITSGLLAPAKVNSKRKRVLYILCVFYKLYSHPFYCSSSSITIFNFIFRLPKRRINCATMPRAMWRD